MYRQQADFHSIREHLLVHVSRQKVTSLFAAFWILISSLAVGQAQFFDSDGISIHYIERGHGTPVVLVHGITVNLEIWTRSRIFQNLAEQYRVIALDLRGHGKSGKPHTIKAYGPEMANDVIRLMDYLGLDKAHVVGYSMGGQLTGYLLANNPNRLISATIAAGAPRRSWDVRDDKYVQEWLQRLDDRARDAGQDDQNDYVALKAVVSSWSLLTVKESQLMANQIPTFATVGSEDPRAEGFAGLSDITPNLKFIMVDGATHFDAEKGLIWQPIFSESVTNFLASVGSN